MSRFIQSYCGNEQPEKYYDYKQCATISIEKAIRYVATCDNQLDTRAKIAKSKCHDFKNIPMSKDESAAIYLYTMDYDSRSLHHLLNGVLSVGEHKWLKEWFCFLKLFNSALDKLVSVRGEIWRGMKNESAQYLRSGDEITWWTFSSCSNSQNTIRQQLDQTSCLCSIVALNGKCIRNYAVNTIEDEVLLLPGTCLRLKEKTQDHRTGRFILYFEELENNYFKEAKSISTSNTSVPESDTSKISYTSHAYLTLNNSQLNTNVHKSQNELIMSATNFENGDRYEVAYRDGKKYGTGIYIHDDTVTNGIMADSKAIGKGVRTWTNGDRYEGDLQWGKMSGLGILCCANGYKYEGNWIADEFYGEGTTTFPNGTRSTGRHMNGKIKGHGKFWSPDGDEYEGDLLDDKAHGSGVRIWKNGERYEGKFSNDKREGYGCYIYASGGSYSGYWQNDEMNGYGTLIWPSGTKYRGYFKDGKRHGSGKLTFSNGFVQEGLWKNDVFKS